jgi:hypothetical protein
MLFRHFIGCLLLCIFFMASSTYAQATPHVDDWQASPEAIIEVTP